MARPRTYDKEGQMSRRFAAVCAGLVLALVVSATALAISRNYSISANQVGYNSTNHQALVSYTAGNNTSSGQQCSMEVSGADGAVAPISFTLQAHSSASGSVNVPIYSNSRLTVYLTCGGTTVYTRLNLSPA